MFRAVDAVLATPTPHVAFGLVHDSRNAQCIDAFGTKGLIRKISTASGTGALVQQQCQLDRVGERFAHLVGTSDLARIAAGAALPNVIQQALRAQTAARASLWASNIDGHSSRAMAAALNVSRGIDGQLDRLTRAAAGIVRAGELTPTASGLPLHAAAVVTPHDDPIAIDHLGTARKWPAIRSWRR